MRNGHGKRVVVIGAGIVGASSAYHLADKGAKVILVEAEDIASGATGASFAWLNTSHPEPDPIAQLRGSAIKEYRRLETQLPGLEIRWTSALSYSVKAIGALPVSGHQTLAKLVCRSQILDLEPNLKTLRCLLYMWLKKERWTQWRRSCIASHSLRFDPVADLG